MRIAVVHLARRQNPPEAFEKFWKSYTDHPAGMEHDVIILWKNFIGADHPSVPEEFNVRHVIMSDQGRDIDAYFKAARMFDYDAFVFLNSWSEINKDGWLKALHESLQDDVGVVAAFSSIMSFRTGFNDWILRMWKKFPFWKKFLLPVYVLQLWLRLWIQVPPHPNFHIRTNGFLIRKKVMLQIHKPFLFDKIDAWKFESGYKSFTRKLLAKGFKVVALDELRLIVDNQVKSR